MYAFPEDNLSHIVLSICIEFEFHGFFLIYFRIYLISDHHGCSRCRFRKFELLHQCGKTRRHWNRCQWLQSKRYSFRGWFLKQPKDYGCRSQEPTLDQLETNCFQFQAHAWTEVQRSICTGSDERASLCYWWVNLIIFWNLFKIISYNCIISYFTNF